MEGRLTSAAARSVVIILMIIRWGRASGSHAATATGAWIRCSLTGQRKCISDLPYNKQHFIKDIRTFHIIHYFVFTATLVDIEQWYLLVIRQLVKLIEWKTRWTFSSWSIRQDSFDVLHIQSHFSIAAVIVVTSITFTQTECLYHLHPPPPPAARWHDHRRWRMYWIAERLALLLRKAKKIWSTCCNRHSRGLKRRFHICAECCAFILLLYNFSHSGEGMYEPDCIAYNTL